jgi:hypothetical protein
MANIKINGNDKELTNLSDDQTSEQTSGQDVLNPEFKVDAELLETPETPKPRVIHNLS